MKKTIFISSTYNDLIDYRKSVWTLLENYDVFVKGMEAFGARKEKPLDTCLNEVSQSDIYIGVIAQRLGSIDEISGKSFTQLEYERALKEDKEILIYLMNEHALISLDNVDFDLNKQTLDNFKSILKSKHTIDTFKDKEDLVSKLVIRLDDILKPKSKSIPKDDSFSYSKEQINKFLLLPKTYSDTEVKIKIKFIGKAFPASKDLCNTFGLSYAQTIGVPIEIVDPILDTKEFKEIFINEDNSKIYFESIENQEYEILARLLFSTTKVKSRKANFFDVNVSRFVKNPDYVKKDPYLGYSASLFDFNTNPYSFASLRSKEEYLIETETIEGDGAAILFLHEHVEKPIEKK
jgi:hypothetical protein